LVSGLVGDHGIAVMSAREGLEVASPVQSDSAPLYDLVAGMLEAADSIHCLRDPTRGGLATALCEIATKSQVGMIVEEQAIPVRESVRGLCELLGLDPLYVACEGRLLAVVGDDRAAAVLAAMRRHPLGRDAALIGRVVPSHAGTVVMETCVGGTRILDLLSGEQLPRIC
jgi:hydrogenase expression/formation protein HypE